MDIQIDQLNAPAIIGPFVPRTEIEKRGMKYWELLNSTFVLVYDSMNDGWVKVRVKVDGK